MKRLKLKIFGKSEEEKEQEEEEFERIKEQESDSEMVFDEEGQDLEELPEPPKPPIKKTIIQKEEDFYTKLCTFIETESETVALEEIQYGLYNILQEIQKQAIIAEIGANEEE